MNFKSRMMAGVLMMTMMGIHQGTAQDNVAGALPAADAAQIQTALQGMDDAWNHHDMHAFVSCMADDVEWVNVVGMWWKGKAEVYRAHEAYHQTIFKDRQIHKPESTEMKLVAPGVVLVTIVSGADGFTTPSGQVTPPGRMVLTEVFVHRADRWLLVQGHNTTIVEEAQRSNPIQR